MNSLVRIPTSLNRLFSSKLVSLLGGGGMDESAICILGEQTVVCGDMLCIILLSPVIDGQLNDLKLS